MKDFLKKRYKFIGFFLALNALLLAFDFSYFHTVSSDHANLLLPLILGELMIEIVLIFVYAFMKKRGMKPETIFLAFFIPLGLLQAFFTPLNQASDEYAHLYRAYDLSKGIRTPKKDEKGKVLTDFPVEGIEAMYNWQNDHHQYDRSFGQMEKSESGETKEKDYSNTLYYSPFSYIPQILGLLVGRLINLPFVAQLYLGRIFALISSAILLFFAIKFVPKYKEFFILVALLPRTIQSGMIYSGDGLLNATAILFIALVFRLAFDEKITKIRAKQLVPILITGAIFSLIKHYAYFPIVLFLLLVPAKKFKRKWSKFLPIVLIFVLTYLGQRVYMPVYSGGSGGGISADSNGIFGLLKFNYFRYLLFMFGTFFGINFIAGLEHLLGVPIGYGGVNTPTHFYTIFFIIFVVALLVRNVETLALKKYQKLLLWAVPILVTCILFYVAMVQWHFYLDKNRGVSVSGRYFTPLLPLIPFMFQPKKPTKKEKISLDYVFLFGLFFEACIIYAKIVYNL